MMMNLFSIFDPSTSMKFELNWLTLSIFLIFMPKNFWFKKSKLFHLFMMMFYFLFKEMSQLLNFKNFNNIIFFLMIFYLILFFNFFGLFPYIFTPTSQLTITLSFSLTIWLSLMLFFWFNYPKIMFAHLVPSGTPSILMPFMVMIELISNFIRPSTLAIRLTANMMAGHLLLCLLGSTGPNSLNFSILIILIIAQNLLFILEMAVSMIQSYVFMTLSSLYSNET
uniref:ATP synthase subunit a n=1 Tax=Orancistrocerus aterrimus TaxID=2485977 RepID=A0A3G3FWD3_9HYME|nr:ATP synthase F0 subunit 6 [Orancistrocerus aterrimus]AYQ18923.1 ATP synthase F0 subunit 6 [Orancistrocerus aterrimus]